MYEKRFDASGVARRRGAALQIPFPEKNWELLLGRAIHKLRRITLLGHQCAAMRSAVLLATLAFVALAHAWGGARATGCSCGFTYVSGAPNTTCLVTCTGGQSHDDITVSGGVITLGPNSGGLTALKWSGDFTNNCPICMSSYGCTPPLPVACWYIVRTDVTPRIRVLGGCYNGGSPNPPTYQMLPAGSTTSGQPVVGNFPPGSKITIMVEAKQGQPGCTLGITNASIYVGQDSKKRGAIDDGEIKSTDILYPIDFQDI
jgi:hypothetical protein